MSRLAMWVRQNTIGYVGEWIIDPEGMILEIVKVISTTVNCIYTPVEFNLKIIRPSVSFLKKPILSSTVSIIYPLPEKYQFIDKEDPMILLEYF